MAILLKTLAAAQAVRYHGATLAEYPVCIQQILGVYWLGCRMHPNGRDILVAERILSPNQVITMAATCGHTVIVYLALQLDTNHIQEAVNMASYGGHIHIVQMCHDYDNVNLDKAMEWAAGGHEEVVRLYRELGASKFDSAMLWAASSGHENILQLFRNWGEGYRFQATHGVGSKQ